MLQLDVVTVGRVCLLCVTLLQYTDTAMLLTIFSVVTCFDIFVVLMRLVVILEFCQMKVKYFDVNGHFINFDYRTSHFSLVYTV